MNETASATPQPEATDIVPPPRHPRIPQLIQLEIAKMDRHRELVAIGVECEAAVLPIALEIERLEGEEAKLVAGAQLCSDRRAELERLAAQHGELRARILDERAAQDARLQAEADRLAAEAAELDAAAAHRKVSRAEVDAALADARVRFDAGRTTTRGRHLERRIREIEKQQETIVTRNPGARYFRVEMAITAEAHRLGLQEKVKSVSAAMQNTKFGEQLGAGIRALRAAKRAEPSAFEVNMLAVDIVHAAGVSTDDVELRVVYRAGRSHIETHLSDAARAKCIASLMKKQARQPTDAEGAAEATAA